MTVANQFLDMLTHIKSVTFSMMLSRPSDEQIREWEEVEFYKSSYSKQQYFTTGQPMSPEHAQWLAERSGRLKNSQIESLDGGSREHNTEILNETERISGEDEISQVPLQDDSFSPGLEQRGLHAGRSRGLMRALTPKQHVSLDFSPDAIMPMASVLHN